jgi:hypothetical protein
VLICIFIFYFFRTIFTVWTISVLDLIIGIGWAYVSLGGWFVLCLPLIYGAMMIGPRCRIK